MLRTVVEVGFKPVPTVYQEKTMARLQIGDIFPSAKLCDIDGASVEFPGVFTTAPATVVFFYRGRW